MALQHLMKWTLLFALLMMIMDSSRANWNIGSKAQVNGPPIHATYFITPNNSPVLVSAEAYVGVGAPNGNCPYTAVYHLGTQMLKTGDIYYIDAYQLKNLINGGYNCMSIYYRYKQLVIDTFVLLFNGVNYVSTVPATDEIVIL